MGQLFRVRAAEHRRALRAYESMFDLVRNRPMDTWAERDRQLYLTLIHQAKTSEAISYRESQLAARDSATPPPMEA